MLVLPPRLLLLLLLLPTGSAAGSFLSVFFGSSVVDESRAPLPAVAEEAGALLLVGGDAFLPLLLL